MKKEVDIDIAVKIMNRKYSLTSYGNKLKGDLSILDKILTMLGAGYSEEEIVNKFDGESI